MRLTLGIRCFMVHAALLLVVTACADTELGVAIQYSHEIQVHNFRKTEDTRAGDDVVLLYTGPAVWDFGELIVAPKMRLAVFDKSIPDTDPLFRNVADGRTGSLYRGMSCRLTVQQLRTGQSTGGLFGLKGDEAAAVELGERALIQLTVGCRRPVS
jgi:hypothetical protein